MNNLAFIRTHCGFHIGPLASLVCLLLVISWPSRADRLYFADGESITGALVSIEAGKVKWASEILGDLSIDQQHVELIDSRLSFRLNTNDESLTNCTMSVQQGQQQLQCDQGLESLDNWSLIISAGADLPESPPQLTQKGTVSVAAENSSGNNEITKYNIAARSELRYIESRHTFALQYQEESAESKTTRNMWRGSYQYDQFFSGQWFATGNSFYEEDEFKGIDERSSVGLGMGYQFLETTSFNLLGKGTVNYVDEELSNGVSRTTPAFLWNLDFTWRVNDAGMEFFHRHVMLQAIDSGDDFEVTTLTGFRYPINGHFNSIIQLEYDYDNLPADDTVEKRDQKWSIGLDYNW
ncbi:MAG: DUF481 domain-containing protein [Halieaceae bacterium]|jgi:putative salt-induced outer membrane protein YdiY|nr:DUF481 domain-containing protein [Halieaceae bacterium]